MDGFKDNVSDEEFHDCLDVEYVSDTSVINPINNFKNVSTVENDPEEHRRNNLDKEDVQIGTITEGSEHLPQAHDGSPVQDGCLKQLHENSPNGNRIKAPTSATSGESKLNQDNPTDCLNSMNHSGKQKSLDRSDFETETSPDNVVTEDHTCDENVEGLGSSKSPNRDTVEESSDESEDESCLTMSEIEERTSEGKKLKNEGNNAYNKGDFQEAIRLYSEGVKICPKRSQKDRAILFSNRSACYAKMDRSDEAIQDCTSAISLHPHYLKVYLRRAQLYDITEKYEEATKDYEKILELDPSIHSARKALIGMPEKIEARNEKLKQQMMSSLKDLGNLFLRPFGLSTDNFQMQQNPDTGSYNVQFNNNTGT